MAVVAALSQRGGEFRRAFGQNNVVLEHNRVAGKTNRFFRGNIDQVSYMLADCPLAVFIECSRKPDGRAIGQRAKTGIEMLKARIDKFD